MSQNNHDDMSDEELVRQLRLEYPHITWSVETREDAPPPPSPPPTDPATTPSAAATAASSPTPSDPLGAARAENTHAYNADQALERNHNMPRLAASPIPAAPSTPAPPEFVYPAPPGSDLTQLPPHARDFFTSLPGAVAPAIYHEMLRVLPPAARAALERSRLNPQAPAFLRHGHRHGGDEDEFEEVVDEVVGDVLTGEVSSMGELLTIPWGYRRTQTGSRRRRPQRWRPLRAVVGEEGGDGVEERKEEKRGRKRKMMRSGP